MRSLTVLIAGTAASLFATSASAQSISCGSEYTVVAGDFLSGIAQRAYGNLNNFNLIYDANVEVIGPNPGIIRIGQRLMIPCLDGETPVTTTASDDSSDAPIQILSASGWRPFFDEANPQGGLLTEIAELAMANAGGDAAYEISYISDLDAHLDPLLSNGAFDVSVGQLQPACDAGNLGEESAALCRNYKFSDPMYEEIFGYYSAASDPEYTNHEALVGKTICRAADFTLVPLEAVNLSEPDITVVRAPDAATCIDALVAGDADVALVAVEVADARITALGVQSDVQRHDDLSYIDFFHAVVAKDHPRGDAILATINDGLRSIKESGLWFQTVRRHMSDFRQANG